MVGASKDQDLAGKPLSFMLTWGLPILALVSTNIIAMPSWLVVSVLTAALAWMGTACLVNARRCQRRHCYIAGPTFLLGALVTALVGFGVVYAGRDGLIYIVWGTLISAVLSYVPEFVWGKYVTTKRQR